MTKLALQTVELRRSFGRRNVIKGLNLELPQGVAMGFLGRNGAGKTTVLRMLVGILSPHSGRIVIGGKSLKRTGPRQRRRVGYVSQEQHFYGWMKVKSLGRFVGAFYPTWDRDRFTRLLDRLAVEPGQRVGALSGGTRMKLALSLALAHRPPLLILDEPTAGVDPVTRREILDLLNHVVKEEGCTVLISTHHIGEIEDIGDRVGILHNGTMFWQGPLTDLSRWARRHGGVLPHGVERLDGDLAWGDPAAWGDVGTPAELEETFVAIARQDRTL